MKNGYSHLKRFVGLLKSKDSHNLDQGVSRLKGVPPMISFSDTAFRRYHDHALASVDFKEASKSGNKHRLYLGLLNGPQYPEAVIYLHRERNLDMIDEVTADLGKVAPPVDALLPPIQGDLFETDEVILVLEMMM